MTEFDGVVAAKDLPDDGVKAGMEGVVVEDYQDGYFEVEFFGPDHETLCVIPVIGSDLRLGADAADLAA